MNSQSSTPSQALGRRYMTLLFADLCESTVIADTMESEHYAAILSALRELYHDIIPRYGGIVVRIQGDGVLAAFGYPTTLEEDGRAAVNAALDLHQQVRELHLEHDAELALNLHSGIHSGLVLVQTGSPELGRLELLGSVPNISARLSEAAHPDEVVVSHETLGPSNRLLETGLSENLSVKGRSDPVDVYRLKATSPFDATLLTRPAHRSSNFIGRGAELRQLTNEFSLAVNGETRCLAILGPAGIGKSRLIEEFLKASPPACHILRVHCEAELAKEALQPLRRIAGVSSEEASSHNIDQIAALIGNKAKSQPLILFVDDFQWADEGTREVVGDLCRMNNLKILIILAVRESKDTVLPQAANKVLRIEPLSEQESNHLVIQKIPQIDPFIAEKICRYANGNSLYLEELCHLASRGDASRDLDRLAKGPGWLSRLVETRLRQLDAEQIQVVRVAAVIGNAVPKWLLERLTSHRVESRLIQDLADQDFLYQDEQPGLLRFKHGIARDIVYESINLIERKSLHQSIALALSEKQAAEQGEDAIEALAFHFGAAGSHEQAAHFAEMSGDKALSVSLLDQSRKFYRAALDSLSKLPENSAIALKWIQIIRRLGRVSVFDAIRIELPLYERAVTLAEKYGDARMMAQTRHWLGYFRYGLGEPLAAIRLNERALAEARLCNDVKLIVQIEAALGQAHCAVAQYEQGRSLLEKVIAIKRCYKSNQHNNVGLAFSLVCHGYLLGDQGNFAEAYAHFDEAERGIGEPDHAVAASIHGWRSAVLLWQGKWIQARESALRSTQVARGSRSLSQISIAQAIKAYADWMLTQDPAYIETILNVTTWPPKHDCQLYRSLNHGWLASGLQSLGRAQEARRHAAIALRLGRQRDLLGAPTAYRALAIASASSSTSVSDNYLAKAMRAAHIRSSQHEIAVTQLCGARIAKSLNDYNKAEDFLSDAIEGFTHMDMPWHLNESHKLQLLVRQKSPNFVANVKEPTKPANR